MKHTRFFCIFVVFFAHPPLVYGGTLFLLVLSYSLIDAVISRPLAEIEPAVWGKIAPAFFNWAF